MPNANVYCMLIPATSLFLLVNTSHCFTSKNIRNDAFVIKRRNHHHRNHKEARNDLMNRWYATVDRWTAIAEIEESSDRTEDFRVIVKQSSSEHEIEDNSWLLKKKPDDNLHFINGTREVYNLASPREWLEYNEVRNRSEGAYTVIRCDLLKKKDDKSGIVKYKLWGKQFHLERVKDSFKQIVNFNSPPGEAKDDSLVSEDSLNIAMKTSEATLDDLILQAMNFCGVKDHNVKILMLTLLWTPFTNNISNEDGTTTNKKLTRKIKIQGHAFCSNIPMDPKDYNPSPISASIALETCLPSRYNNIPIAKNSSWCRIRQSIESCYKSKEIGEVFLTRPTSQAIYVHTQRSDSIDGLLLEGLTSNIFIVYKDGSLHTCHVKQGENGGVLGGYGRRLVLEAARKCNMPVVVGPIDINDGKEGLWAEVFVTSSIKVIAPVNKIFVVDPDTSRMKDEGNQIHLEDFWSEVTLDDLNWNSPRWKVLYEAILESS